MGWVEDLRNVCSDFNAKARKPESGEGIVTEARKFGNARKEGAVITKAPNLENTKGETFGLCSARSGDLRTALTETFAQHQ